jgi:hypothetical protein
VEGRVALLLAGRLDPSERLVVDAQGEPMTPRTYRAVWLRLLGCALLIVAAGLVGGCALIDWYPEGGDCRTNGCPAGKECKPQPVMLGPARSACEAVTTTTTTQPAEADPVDPPKLTCASMDCITGYTCQDTPQGPQCVPVTPPASSCPKDLAPGAYAFVNAKPYGQGVDSETRVYGDTEFCEMIHGVSTNNCHLEGWPKRVECEQELLGGCPVWQWAPSADGPWTDARQAEHPVLSMDHWGDPVDRDDPQTPTTGDTLATLRGFEGEPKACGLQRDEIGDPMAGFFIIAHGHAFVRPCKTDGTGCGRSVEIDH